MARIIFTWELGAHYGHLARQIPIADKLRLTGHELLFAVRDTCIAAEMLLPLRQPFVQAPVFLGHTRLRRQPANYAELLLADGFAEPMALLGRVQAWLRIFDQFRPDAMVADHSPTALVAARAAGLRTVQVGNGFEIPPPGDPLPAFNVCAVPIEQLKISEARVVACVNTVLRSCGRPQHCIGCLSELFEIEAKLLASFAELDHYGVRQEANYIGPLTSNQHGAACAWKLVDRRRVFAYLHNGMPGTALLVDALRTCDAEIICVISGLAESAARRLSTLTMRVLPQLVQLQTLLPDADVVVSNGGSLVPQALMAAAPLLLCPYTLEQHMQSSRVVNIGAGCLVSEKREPMQVGEQLHELLTDSTYRRNAQSFALKYASHDPGYAVKQAVAVIAQTGPVKRVH